jgi:hypothetical protein
MVNLALLQSVSYIAGAVGVCVAAFYYVMNLRMTQKRAKIDAAILYGNLITDKEKVKAWRSFLYEVKGSSFEELEKYRTDPELYSNMYTTAGSLARAKNGMIYIKTTEFRDAERACVVSKKNRKRGN